MYKTACINPPTKGPTHQIQLSVVRTVSFPLSLREMDIHLHFISPFAIANAKHLAGLKALPLYPPATPVDAKLTSPSTIPASIGNSFGPKRALERGSKATPNRRNRKMKLE